MNTDGDPGTASAGYAAGEMARAFVTALTHEEAETRLRADRRIDRWAAVLRGMADGSVRVGRRDSVRELPAWVTLEVLRGGFATGAPVAARPVTVTESGFARSARIPPERAGLFAHLLTEPGLAALWELLDSGCYRVEIPEEGALLTVAWLVRTGAVREALDLVDVLGPFADRLRFTGPRDRLAGDGRAGPGNARGPSSERACRDASRGAVGVEPAGPRRRRSASRARRRRARSPAPVPRLDHRAASGCQDRRRLLKQTY